MLCGLRLQEFKPMHSYKVSEAAHNRSEEEAAHGIHGKARKIEDLTRELSESKERTLDRLMKNYADAELKYKSNQKVYDAAMKSVDKDMAICMQAAENLLDGAISALKNRAGIK